MRYEIIIEWKETVGTTSIPVKSLHLVNTWLEACIDDTVKSADVRDTITKAIITYQGHRISKASFVQNGIPKRSRRKNLARYL